MEPDSQPDPLAVSRPRRGRIILALAILVVVLLGIVWTARLDTPRNERLDARTGLPAPATARDPIGTSGDDDVPRGTEENSGPPAVVPPPSIQRLAALAGGDDVEDLIGRRVDLYLTVHDIANDVAFWVEDGPHRMLVVMARDNRSEVDRQTGRPSSHRIEPVRAGQYVTISGTVERLPWAEAMFSWGLTNHDAAELRDRYAYIRADRVTAERQP